MLGLKNDFFFFFKYFSSPDFSIISFRQLLMKFSWLNSFSILDNKNMNVTKTDQVLHDIRK